MVVNSQPPFGSNPLSSQPPPNPKGGINVVQTTSNKDAIIDEEEDDEEEEDEEEEEEEDEEDDEWLYELLAKLAGVESDSKDEYEDTEDEDTAEEDKVEEMTEIIKEATEKEESSLDKEEEFFITTVYEGNEENQKTFLRSVLILDPIFVMPLELYKVLDLGPLKKTIDTFHLANTSTVSMVGIAEDVIVKMAHKGPSPSAKGKAKVYGPTTRASPRLAA
ncbi:hypothetical protein PIB30_078210 [Stylosanthes scabra]|uniref:Uncharacterized protein n=1 Tax=Stylosanthes scabra TaxID=79078 RepID=A0ABU6RR43_9FABA|nr:hypothetical protein [Stylosanthes scabra]